MKFQKNVRLRHYNYSSNGAYFITVCTDRKKNQIGEAGKRIIEEEFKGIETRFPGVKVDFYVIMETHIHFILCFQEAKTNLFGVIQTFKSLTTLKFKRQGYKGRIFWQKNYYEHVIRNEDALSKVRNYIQNNPLAEKLRLEEIYERREKPKL